MTRDCAIHRTWLKMLLRFLKALRRSVKLLLVAAKLAPPLWWKVIACKLGNLTPQDGTEYQLLLD